MSVLDIAQYTDQLNTYFADLPRVGLAYLFGSQARRKAGPLSDVDIAVLLEGTPDADTCFDLRLEIIGGMMYIFTWKLIPKRSTTSCNTIWRTSIASPSTWPTSWLDTSKMER